VRLREKEVSGFDQSTPTKLNHKQTRPFNNQKHNSNITITQSEQPQHRSKPITTQLWCRGGRSEATARGAAKPTMGGDKPHQRNPRLREKKKKKERSEKMMHMTFYWGKNVTLLVDLWQTTSWTSYHPTRLLHRLRLLPILGGQARAFQAHLLRQSRKSNLPDQRAFASRRSGQGLRIQVVCPEARRSNAVQVQFGDQTQKLLSFNRTALSQFCFSFLSLTVTCYL
jgi:hypothetical protein